MEPVSFPKLTMEKPRSRTWLLVVFLAVLAGFFMGFRMSGRPPSGFVPGTLVVIPEGASARQAARILKESDVIRSPAMFEFSVKALLGGRPVRAGEFMFDKPQRVLRVAELVTGGIFGNAQARITIPEGSSTADIARIMQKAIPDWNIDEFSAKAKPLEGYLFPETYFVFKTITPDLMIDRLTKEYEERVAPLRPEMEAAKKTEKQIVIMASLLEKEARNAEEAAVISGILWRRIELGMPLQVDAPFLFTLGKTSEQLKASDLQKDGPYNTYTRKGLPVGPIGNPGLAMIRAAIHPEPSKYLYYLHDKNGTIYYARNYQEHLANKNKYLK